MVRAAPDLVGDCAATDMNLGEINGVLPDLIDQLGL
jgi:hypothetical protein